MIFLTVGTTKFPFDRVLEAVDRGMMDSGGKEQLIVQKGVSRYRFKYKRARVYQEVSFEKMVKNFKEARVVISHGGPATIFLALKYGKNRPLIVPRTKKLGEHVDDHEVHFGRFLKRREKVEAVFPQEDLFLKIKQYLAHPKKQTSRREERPSLKLVKNLKKYSAEIAEKKRQRPLFIVYISLGLGGIERKIVDLVNYCALHRPGLPIYILLRDHSDFDISHQIKNKQVRVINYLDWSRVKIPFFFPVFVLWQARKLRPRAMLAFLDYSSWMAVWAKLFFFWRGITVVLNEDHFASEIIATYAYPKIRFLLVKTFYPFADVIISPTREAKVDLVKNLGIPAGKIKCVPNWTGFTAKKSWDTSKEYDLIFIGRLVRTKNLQLLLKAVKRLRSYKKDIKLALVGEGGERTRLEALSKRYEIMDNVEFVGSREDVEDLLPKAKIFIYSSKYKVEGFPVAILEAMALGVPVLTRRFAGAGEVIKDGESGFIFSSLEELVEKGRFLLKSSGVRKRAAQRARTEVRENYSLGNVEKFLEALQI